MRHAAEDVERLAARRVVEVDALVACRARVLLAEETERRGDRCGPRRIAEEEPAGDGGGERRAHDDRGDHDEHLRSQQPGHRRTLLRRSAPLAAPKRLESPARLLRRPSGEVGAERTREPAFSRSRSRAASDSAVSSYSVAATLAEPRRSATPVTTTVQRISPRRISSVSPTRTSFAGFTRSPPTWTCPPATASVAALRVLKNRAAQSHRSIRTRSIRSSSQRAGVRADTVRSFERASRSPPAFHLGVDLEKSAPHARARRLRRRARGCGIGRRLRCGDGLVENDRRVRQSQGRRALRRPHVRSRRQGSDVERDRPARDRRGRTARRGPPARRATPERRALRVRSRACSRRGSHCAATGRADPVPEARPSSRSRSASRLRRPPRSTTCPALRRYPPAAREVRAPTRRRSRGTSACTRTASR